MREGRLEFSLCVLLSLRGFRFGLVGEDGLIFLMVFLIERDVGKRPGFVRSSSRRERVHSTAGRDSENTTGAWITEISVHRRSSHKAT